MQKNAPRDPGAASTKYEKYKHNGISDTTRPPLDTTRNGHDTSILALLAARLSKNFCKIFRENNSPATTATNPHTEAIAYTY